MKTLAAVATVSALLALGMPAHAQEHRHEQFGKVEFANSCAPEVQESFQDSVAMLHSFRHLEAEMAFREVLAQDPSCAIATWGIASILMSNPLAGVGPALEWAARAQAAIIQGREIGAKTRREREYIEAVAAYYDDWANRPERMRQINRSRAFETLAARYPDDDEAQIFSALYLSSTQDLSDQTYATYLRAAAILEKQFAKHPDHPGVAHYLIHSYDAPPIAARGLDAARRYASIAPDAPHALHMPSHIFTRVGAWNDSITTNERSAAAAGEDGDVESQLHAMDYMTYALLQLARDADARRVTDEGARVTGNVTLRFAGPYAMAAMPARYALERGDWKQAMALQATASQFSFADAQTYYARALGAARSGDLIAARSELVELERLRDALAAANNKYWATEAENSRLVTSAWIALAEGRNDEALAMMQSAADMEDRNEKHIVTPGRLVPARELLGEMLLELNRPADALKEFEASQLREPGRFRSLYGAARSAEQNGDKVTARRYYARLVENAAANADRSELRLARTFLAAHP